MTPQTAGLRSLAGTGVDVHFAPAVVAKEAHLVACAPTEAASAAKHRSVVFIVSSAEDDQGHTPYISGSGDGGVSAFIGEGNKVYMSLVSLDPCSKPLPCPAAVLVKRIYARYS